MRLLNPEDSNTPEVRAHHYGKEPPSTTSQEGPCSCSYIHVSNNHLFLPIAHFTQSASHVCLLYISNDEMSQQSHPSLPPSSPYSIQDEESPSHETDNDNNSFGSPQPYDNEYVDNGSLSDDLFGNNFDFNDAWVPEVFNFESPLRDLESPAPFPPQPPGSTPRLPPSNQQANNIPRSAPANERPQIGQNPFRLADSDPFAEYFGFTPPRPSATPQSSRAAASGQTTRRSSVVDLTGSPPAEMPPETRERKRKERGSGSTSEGRPTKLSRLVSKEPKYSKPKDEDTNVIDLSDFDDGTQYKDFQAKQQAEAIKQQNLDEATRPVKLADFQCIICMDNPTDLTVTHCGKSVSSNVILERC